MRNKHLIRWFLSHADRKEMCYRCRVIAFRADLASRDRRDFVTIGTLSSIHAQLVQIIDEAYFSFGIDR